MSLEESLEELVKNLPGLDSASRGKLYQNYPWPPLDGLPSLLTDTEARLEFITSRVRVAGRSVLDIGCANGALSIGLALKGARVTGWDRDAGYIRVAGKAAQILVPGPSGPRFVRRGVVDGLKNHFDIILFLSVFKWIVKEQGMETGEKVLEDVFGHCEILVFEAGLGDSGVDLINLKKKDIGPLLEKYTGFGHMEIAGTFPRDPAHNIDREIWICRHTNPRNS